MKKILFLVFFPIFLYSSNYLSSLNKVYVQDKFRYFYTLEGENGLSIKNQVDENEDKIPDYIENIANQLSQVYNLFINDFGFKSPLEQERFKGKTNFIDIHFINLKENGAASDLIVNRSLIMKLSINLIPETLTPLHEFFHLIQYGYSMFNNRWSMEGQARWAEYSFRKGVGDYSNKLPISFEELEKLFNSIYEAKDFWNRIAYLCSNNKKYFLSSKNYSYINGDHFLKDNNLYGYEIIKSILENYSLFSKKAESFYLYKSYNWTEKQQKSFNNNQFILQAIKKSLQNYHIDEIKEFTLLIDKYLNYLQLQNNRNDFTKEIKELKENQIKSLDDSYKLKYLNNLIDSKIIKQSEIFPSKSIYYNIPKKIIRSIKYKNGFIYIGAYEKHEKLKPFGLYYGEIKDSKLVSIEITLEDNFIPWDIFLEDKNLFLMVAETTSEYKKIKVFKNKNELNNWDLQFQFKTKLNIEIFFLKNNKFIFSNRDISIFLKRYELSSKIF